MIDGLPVGLANGIGVVAVIVILGWMIATGRLVTRREHDTVIHDRDEWRAESRIRDAEVAEKNKQLVFMAEVGKTMHAVLTALQRIAKDDEVNR